MNYYQSNLVPLHLSSSYLILLAFLFASCTAAKKSGTTDVAVAEHAADSSLADSLSLPVLTDKIEGYKPSISESISDAKVVQGNTEVSGCSVEATIISIDPTLDSTNPETPCGRVPCAALIRIDKIVKMGQQCAPYVVSGAELWAYFKITLSKTDSLFPDMRRHFSGLEKSDTFAATFITTSNQSDGYHIVINGYKKTE